MEEKKKWHTKNHIVVDIALGAATLVVYADVLECLRNILSISSRGTENIVHTTLIPPLGGVRELVKSNLLSSTRYEMKARVENGS